MLSPEPSCTILQNIFRAYGSGALSDRVEAELRGLSGLRNSALVVLYGPVGHCRLKMFCKIVQRGSGNSIASLSSFPRRDWPCDNAAEASRMKIAAATPVSQRGTGRANPVQTALWSRLPRPVPACHTQSPLKPARPHRTSGQSPHTELCFDNLGTALDASTLSATASAGLTRNKKATL